MYGGEWSTSCPGRFTPWNEQEAGLVPESGWTLWKIKKILATDRVRTPNRSSCSLVAMLK